MLLGILGIIFSKDGIPYFGNLSSAHFRSSSSSSVEDESSKLITAPTFWPHVMSSTPQTATSFISGCSINILSTCNAPTLYPPVLITSMLLLPRILKVPSYPSVPSDGTYSAVSRVLNHLSFVNSFFVASGRL